MYIVFGASQLLVVFSLIQYGSSRFGELIKLWSVVIGLYFLLFFEHASMRKEVVLVLFQRGVSVTTNLGQVKDDLGTIFYDGSCGALLQSLIPGKSLIGFLNTIALAYHSHFGLDILGVLNTLFHSFHGANIIPYRLIWRLFWWKYLNYIWVLL